MAHRRVVVTGTGLVTPLGIGVAESWGNICAGVSGVARVTRFDVSDYVVKIAAEVKGFDAADHFEKKAAKNLDLFVQYALVAARMAVSENAQYGAAGPLISIIDSWGDSAPLVGSGNSAETRTARLVKR